MNMPRIGKQIFDWTKILGMTAALLAVLASGCATGEINVASHYNNITGLRTDLLENNLLVGEEDPPRELIYLNASRVYRDFRNYDYYLEVFYMAPLEVGFLDIRPGPSLTIVADDQEYAYRSSGSANTRRQDDEFVYENTLYSVTEADIERLATSQEVVVRVTGFNGIVQRSFTEKNFERFNQFTAMHTDQIVW